MDTPHYFVSRWPHGKFCRRCGEYRNLGNHVSPLRDADEVVGRITARGAWDLRYRPKPGEPHKNPLVEIVAGVFVLLLLFVGLGMWAWIGAVAAQ